MAYNEKLAEKVRKLLFQIKNVEEKKMMGGLTFMVNNKMCVGVVNDNLMCRIDPEMYESALKKKACSPMDFTGKPMKGFVFINSDGTNKEKDLNYWISLALDYNKKAKSSKKN